MIKERGIRRRGYSDLIPAQIHGTCVEVVDVLHGKGYDEHEQLHLVGNVKATQMTWVSYSLFFASFGEIKKPAPPEQRRKVQPTHISQPKLSSPSSSSVSRVLFISVSLSLLLCLLGASLNTIRLLELYDR